MKPFLDKDFLLSTPTAQKLFHEYAENIGYGNRNRPYQQISHKQ